MLRRAAAAITTVVEALRREARAQEPRNPAAGYSRNHRATAAYRDAMSRDGFDGADGREEFDTDHSPDDDLAPVWFPGQHLPPDARRMGLTHHVPDGALLDFAGNLDGTKRRHRIVAWVLLVVFGIPVLMAVLRLVFALLAI